MESKTERPGEDLLSTNPKLSANSLNSPKPTKLVGWTIITEWKVTQPDSDRIVLGGQFTIELHYSTRCPRDCM
jgi:hypothetical protein